MPDTSQPLEIVDLALSNKSIPVDVTLSRTLRQRQAFYQNTINNVALQQCFFTMTFKDPEVEEQYQTELFAQQKTKWIMCNVAAMFVFALLWIRYLVRYPLDSSSYQTAQLSLYSLPSIPKGWFLYPCSAETFCHTYSMGSDLTFLFIGILLPLVVNLILFKLNYIQRSIQLIPVLMVVASVLFIRDVVIEQLQSPKSTAMRLCYWFITATIFARVRFCYTIICSIVLLIGIIIMGVIANQFLPLLNHDIEGIQWGVLYYLLGVAVSITSTYEMEEYQRASFKVTANLKQQCESLKSSRFQRSALIKTPLDKILESLRDLVSNSATTPDVTKRLSVILKSLVSKDLNVPGIAQQVTDGDVSVLNEQEAWILSMVSSFDPQRCDSNSALSETRSSNRIASFKSADGGAGGMTQDVFKVETDTVKSLMSKSMKSDLNRVSTFSLKNHTKSGGFLESLSGSEDAIQTLLDNTYLWNYPLFTLESLAGFQSLFIMSHYIFTKTGLFDTFGIPLTQFSSFVMEIQNGYRSDIPYHTSIHALDVLQTVYFFSQLPEYTAALNSFDLLALYFAAIIHDYQHPGTNSNFLINTGDSRAILYNDRSVLENHHLAAAFAVLNKPGNNFLSGLTKPEFKQFRNTVVELVLATDLTKHFVTANNFHSIINLSDQFDPQNRKEDKDVIMIVAIKCADVSNPCKEFSIYNEWVKRIMKEFFFQGDQEKAIGLPVSPFMDRDSCNIPSCQIGFINYIVKPIFNCIFAFADLPLVSTQLANNLTYWEQNKDEDLSKIKFKARSVARSTHIGSTTIHDSSIRTSAKNIQDLALQPMVKSSNSVVKSATMNEQSGDPVR